MFPPGQNTKLKGPALGQTPPGLEPRVFAPGIVSTSGNLEFSIAFTPDGKEIYFTRRRDPGGRNTMMVCRWENDGWTAPEEASFCKGFASNEPHITPDGKKLYFGCNRPKPGSEEADYGIWVTERTEKGWGEPRYHGPGMYVSSTRRGDLYMTDITNAAGGGLIKYSLAGGALGAPARMPDAINAPEPVAHAFIAPDESYVVFDSYGRPGAQGGEGDLYVCFRKEDGSWGEAVNLGDTINTPGTNFCPMVSPDGKYLFYAACRDIYWVSAEVIHRLRQATENKANPGKEMGIHQAAQEGDLAKIKELTAANPQLVNSKDERGRTPLMWACGRDRLEIVRFLVENNADVNSLDGMEFSALYYSIKNNSSYEIDEMLVRRGAAFNYSKGKSLLFLAAQLGKEKTVGLLLKFKADPNQQNTVGKTPLYIAGEYNRPGIVATLLANKADPAIRDHFGRTPLHQAAVEGYGKVAELLVAAGSAVNEKDHLERTPLFYAEKHGHKKLAAFLQAKGGLSNEHEKNFGRSPQLVKQMGEKEAVIWYLGHTGWAVKTRSKLLIFDYWGRGRADEPRLANGRIDPEEIQDLDVIVFVSHSHEDHYDEAILAWAKTIKKITYIFGWKNEKAGQAVFMGPREKKMIGDMEVQLVNSPQADPLDNAFLVKTDGLAIYHGGDYGILGGVAQITEVYTGDMDYLKNQAQCLDIMFLTGLLIKDSVPAYIPFTIRAASPGQLFLMHQGAAEYNLKALADELAKTEWPSKIIAPLDRGQVYIHVNKKR